MVRTQGHAAVRSTVGTSSLLEINTREWPWAGPQDTPHSKSKPFALGSVKLQHTVGGTQQESHHLCVTHGRQAMHLSPVSPHRGTACNTLGRSVTTEGNGA